MTKLLAVTGFFGLVSVLCTAGAAAKTPHAVRQALGSSVCGIATLGAAALLAPFTGLSLAVNWFTAFAAVVLGAPGVVTMLLLRVLLAAG
ncbi:MAG TPA: pro-sigmaK processing inhibitor BofA family protein [Candidatus Anaerofilum faecale]|nr:pro-sigmaK processing inhibitor BofA family protein [Anaerofilum sp. An201]OUP01702.1 hypothetical protein B5F36_11915 [Anaerofilum sp. An201]HIX12075.1 pro-sigmaK processing inhibitor BofA family protein [Candidatus Anaerofilum faecale]